MRILKRDRRRCRVCGRSPDDFVDVTLHVHHIVPWSRSGDIARGL
jgi:5-methylcytosine-specific restriction endonuclease McrA